MHTTQDQSVLSYQETGDPEQLIAQYGNFINKYYFLIKNGNIDFSNYDIRCFLSCYVSDEGLSRSLRRGKYHSSETIASAYKVLRTLRHKLRNHNEKEMYHEILIPFLQLAQGYKQVGVGFDKYLYKAYKYELKRHLDNMKWDALDHGGLLYRDISVEEEWEEEIPEELVFEMDEQFELSDPRWIHGHRSGEPFSDLKPHERYILVKYYYEEYTDREIARMLPFNPKSIQRIRKRLTTYLQNLYDEGELRCLRL